MPKVPEYPKKPLKPLYKTYSIEPTLKQKSLLMTLYERRKLPKPDFKNMTGQEASQIISNMLSRGN